MEELLFARIREDAVIPSKRVEDAGYDIYAAFDEAVSYTHLTLPTIA